jgi:PKD repeat protein
MAPRAVSRFARAALSGVLVAGAMTVVFAQAAAAAPAPIEPITTSMVSSDALPTVQINGVVWQQAIVGNRVYAGGSFSTARPAGAAPGTNTVTRNNLLAYDLTTGVLIDSFAPAVNGQIRAVTASPDGTRIYVAGDFTAVGAVTRSRIAAFDALTGALITSFDARVDYTVRALVATNTTLYAGGAFANSRGVARARLAAFSSTNGALLGWNPSTDGTVHAMVMAPDGSKLIIGGSFANVNGVANYGMAAVSATTSALVTPWNATQKIRNAGQNSAITSLNTDGTSIFGSGYRFGSGGNLEGAFRLNPANGDIIWVEDCHGDTYDSATMNGVLYTVSHAHFCGNIGGFYQTEPWAGNMRHALAFSNAATGTINEEKLGYFNWEGTPSPSLYNWFPDMTNGSYTGQTQAAWDVTAASNGQYIVMGGEFPSVNGTNQQGLVRFAVKSIAPNRDGPRVSGAAFAPRLAAINASTVRVSWQTNWDRDDLTLTYQVYRDGVLLSQPQPITADSTFWNRPSLSITDSGLTPGFHNYRVEAIDGSQNVVTSSVVTVNTNNVVSPYVRSVLTDGAGQFWRLGEAGGTTAFDSAGFSDAAIASVTRGATGAISTDTDAATTFAGTQASQMRTSIPVQGPNTFTVEAWFKTNTTLGGKIVGFGNQPLIDSTSYDRQIYMNNAGRIYFGVNNGSARTVNSTSSFNDNQWHHVVGTLGSTGMRLYIDGVQVGANAAVTSAQNYQGYWRVGGDQTRNWSNAPSSNYFAGSIDEVAIYPVALSAGQVTAHYQAASGTATNQAPTASFTSTVANLGVSVNGSASTDPDGSIATYSWNWGDGTAADSGVTATHSYASAGNWTVILTVTDNLGLTSTASQVVTTTTPPANQPPIASFSSTVTNLSVAFNASGSSDPDGTVASYSWNWGDGTPAGSGVSPTHAYTAAGTYLVSLTVTDNNGASTTTSSNMSPSEAPNAAPVAAFTSSATGLTATVNGAGSTDSDGTVASYVWSWGDGTPDGTGVSASHTYGAVGTYSVTLTVTDDDGATNSISRNVPVSTAVIADAFNRAVVNSWGSADTGGAWTLTGANSRFSSNGQSGAILVPAAGQTSATSLNGASVRDFDGVVDLSIDKAATGSGVYETISTRKIGNFSYQFTLKFLANSTVSLAIVRVDGAGSNTLLTSTVVPGLTYAVGEAIRVRFQTIGTGTTTLAVKAWKASAAEPAAFFATRNDSSAALQASGGFGLTSYLSSNASIVNLSTIVDNLVVTGN